MEEQASDIRNIVRETIEEFVRKEHARTEPAYKAELIDEKRRREQLERRVNELVEENRKSRQMAEEADRRSAIRAELQKLGVTKVDLAYRAVQDDIVRTEDGRLLARSDEGDMSVREYLGAFIRENPEFLPARIAGGSGATAGNRVPPVSGPTDFDKIRPGMSSEDADKVRQEILRVAEQTFRGA
ncbi:MAG TPA: hypothetical protein VN428_06670 [Bryobacteraceae bacterium]|nr:hypothetical protein [Bryobacteraceae bacterium]